MPEQEPTVSREKIEIQEVVQAIQNLKSRTATGPDELHKEVFKTLLKDKNTPAILTKFFNKIYDTRVLLQDWL